MLGNTSTESSVSVPPQTQTEDDVIAPSQPKLKRQRGQSSTPRSPKKAALAATVTSREEALATSVTVSSSRKFNNVDYDSFASPVFVTVRDCAVITPLSKYGKYLVRVPDDAAAPLLAMESVISALSPEGFTFAGLGNGLDGGVYSLKWNSSKTKRASMFIREDAAQLIPVKGDVGLALIEISGMYRNAEHNTCGLVTRVASFQTVSADVN